jgi:undecaprenyl-diphosphatase
LANRLRNSPVDRLRIALLAIVTLALSVLASVIGTLPGDIAVERFIQRTPQPPARWIADFGNWIGSATPVVVITLTLAVVLFARHYQWEAGILLLTFAARAINPVLKTIIDSPRPTANVVRVTEHASGLGFPSGHASGSMLGFGAIAVVTSTVIEDRTIRRVIQAVCALLILIVGFGRIYVGAHWPSDVLGGYLWGVLLLAAIVALINALRRRRSRTAGTTDSASSYTPPVA